ncbi:GRP family sugar transporter [Acidicapsa ligni]|uniref:GRP family sugar transporter n=1 Tax=Acidicapsa ligni TaxID=542300 RepID=UPI0021DF6503|nr:GRP family sugar transporter [Acidicapsa ligni]
MARDQVRSGATKLHLLGVICGIAAGAWLGGAEAPTKLVLAGLSPFTVSLCMVAGVFVARWTFPTLLRGTSYVFTDLRSKPHLIVWAILAGALWAVGNTLTVFAIRNVGLAVAFPLWNTNCLIGILWGCLLFRELRGASATNWLKVIGGAVAIVAAAIMLGFSLLHGASGADGKQSTHAVAGLLAALGASFMWGTMYVPYKKAYLSGMNPLSFVTVFTIGELITMFTLAITLGGGVTHIRQELINAKGVLFWLFLGGFCWVVGDLFQQYATKYIGIGRGIPLSNTNQLWGLAWGALVFGELANADRTHVLLVVGGSIIMILGALAISTAAASSEEHHSTDMALNRECQHYGLNYEQTRLSLVGLGESSTTGARRWWDYLIVAVAVCIFVALGRWAQIPAITMNMRWVIGLSAVSLVFLAGAGWRLWRDTGFF